VASFEIDLDIPALNGLDQEHNRPFHAVFIRAPLIESVEGTAQILATLPDGSIVAAQQGNLLATSFHPELTQDDRIHRYFISLVREYGQDLQN
jgi:5'-phosphate synthase pdxT subunit